MLISCRAARVTTSNIAHVIFLTHDVSFSKSLSKALPDRVFRQISLSDTSIEVAKRFVINHIDFESEDAEAGIKKLTPSQRRKDLGELDSVLPALGGRLTDLEFLARRIKAGETPRKAVREIVEQSASEILKMFVLGQDDSGNKPGYSSSSSPKIKAYATTRSCYQIPTSPAARKHSQLSNKRNSSPFNPTTAVRTPLSLVDQSTNLRSRT